MGDSHSLPGLEALLRASGVPVSAEVDLRRIGTDDEMVRLIIERIAIGEKTMTYSLPWIARHEGRPEPRAGGYIAPLGPDGRPALLLRLTRVEELRFGEIGEAHIQREGKPLRRIEVWRPLHIEVWNRKLAPLGRTVTEEMPVWAEYFDLVGRAGETVPGPGAER